MTIEKKNQRANVILISPLVSFQCASCLEVAIDFLPCLILSYNEPT